MSENNEKNKKTKKAKALNVLTRVAQSKMLSGKNTSAVLLALPELRLDTQFMGAVKGVKGAGGRTRVMYAAFTGNMDELQKLVTAKNVNDADITGQTALLFATFQEHVDAVRFLVEKGADVNRQTRDENTALHMAVYKNNLEIGRLLCENGADVNMGAERYSPIHLAAGYANVSAEFLEMLCAHGGKVNLSGLQGTPLHMVRDPEGAQKVDVLCRFGANIEARVTNSFYNGHTPLLMACEMPNNHGIILALCERGADVNVTSTRRFTNGMTPLMIACNYKTSDGSVTTLCEFGSDKELVVDGKTPLILAIDRTNGEPSEGVVRELLEQGANPSEPAFNGETPLGFAVIQQNIPAIRAICQFAQSRGVDVGIEGAVKSVNRKLLENQTALGRIEMRGQPDVRRKRELNKENEELNEMLKVLTTTTSTSSAFPRGGGGSNRKTRKRGNRKNRKSRSRK